MSEHLPREALVVLGASQEHIPLYQEARRRGMPSIAVDVRRDAPGVGWADAALTVSTRDVAAIAAALEGCGPAGIVGGASDAALASWHTLSARFAGGYVYPKRALAACDKVASRALAAACGIAGCPWVFSHDPATVVAKARQLRFPLVVKPSGGSGSRGVTRVDRPAGLAAAVAHARSYGGDQAVIVEELARGRPLAVQVFMAGGQAVMACALDKRLWPDTFVVRGLCTAELPDAVYERVRSAAERLCRALGIVDGPASVDMALDTDGQVRFIEINPRLGGDGVPRLLAAAYGVDVVRAVVAMALGEPFSGLLRPTRASHAGLELIGSPVGVAGELVSWGGVAEACHVRGVTDIALYAQPGDRVWPHHHSGRTIGLVVAAGATPAQACAAVAEARGLVRPHVVGGV